MARTKIPSYRLHAPSGQAVATIDGKDVYLGKHGSGESRRKYDRAISEWLARGRGLSTVDRDGGVTCGEVARLYRARAATYYVKRGQPTPMADLVRRVMERWSGTWGDLPLTRFGPAAFKALRGTWVRDGCARSTINEYAQVVKQAVRWAVAEELAAPAVLEALRAVPGLPRGRSEAREAPEVGPVAPDVLAATLGALRPVWQAVIQVQMAAGMRPGEVLAIRPDAVDRSGTPWVYVPESHKTEHHGRDRRIALGPKAREVLGPWLDRQPDPRGPAFHASYLTTPYVVASYQHAITRACDRAGVARWAPNQLRHAAASAINAAFGLDGARAALGHAKAQVTLLYAARDWDTAAKIAEAMG